jgi:hypothetical protein
VERLHVAPGVNDPAPSVANDTDPGEAPVETPVPVTVAVQVVDVLTVIGLGTQVTDVELACLMTRVLAGVEGIVAPVSLPPADTVKLVDPTGVAPVVVIVNVVVIDVPEPVKPGGVNDADAPAGALQLIE